MQVRKNAMSLQEHSVLLAKDRETLLLLLLPAGIIELLHMSGQHLCSALSHPTTCYSMDGLSWHTIV
jgi:hypothetical protein